MNHIFRKFRVSDFFFCLDLIQLKSPTPTSHATDSKLTNERPRRRRSADVADVPQYYTEDEHVLNEVHSTVEKRSSALLTPTATSFSKADLNEIFNISRESMDVQRSAALSTAVIQKNITENTSMSVAMTTPEKCHNVAMNESNFSMNSSVLDSSCASQADTEMNNSSCASSDGNNNTNNHVTSLRLPTTNATKMSPISMDTPSPGSGKSGSLSKLQMVCREIFMTEKSYVNDLQDIIEVR